jgi:NADP-dependent 3-hydroxy acid dehydrogenase YdfG
MQALIELTEEKVAPIDLFVANAGVLGNIEEL